jgi:two-component system sensor histidine kinase UhpB
MTFSCPTFEFIMPLKVHSLRYQINIRILLLFCFILIFGFLLTIFHAKRAVQAEMQSSIQLAQQLVTFGFSQNLARQQWLAQLNTLKETRHLHIQLKEPSGNMLTELLSQRLINQKNASLPPFWFVKLIGDNATTLEHTLMTKDGETLIVLIQANPLNEIIEVWEESLLFFSLLLLWMTLILLVMHFIFKGVLNAISLIVAGLELITLGDYHARLPAFLIDDMNKIANAINQLTAQLQCTEQENRALTQHILTIQEEERQHLAQSLHDELGQSLTAINVMSVAIVRADESNNAVIKESCNTIIELSRHLMMVVRSMMKQLHPLTLDMLGLKAAIDDLIHHWQSLNKGMQIIFQCDESIDCLPKSLNIQLFRIVQESLTNIMRHANAHQVIISLRLKEDNQVLISIVDDGHGCSFNDLSNGFGLLSMRERVRSLNGEFNVKSHKDQGVAIKVLIPL